jgi:hypothetical protein
MKYYLKNIGLSTYCKLIVAIGASAPERSIHAQDA